MLKERKRDLQATYAWEGGTDAEREKETDAEREKKRLAGTPGNDGPASAEDADGADDTIASAFVCVSLEADSSWLATHASVADDFRIHLGRRLRCSPNGPSVVLSVWCVCGVEWLNRRRQLEIEEGSDASDVLWLVVDACRQSRECVAR